MKRIQIACAGMLLSSALFLAGFAHAEDTLRPEIGKPMLAAQELIKAQKYKEAMTKIHDAEAFSGRTAYENFIIERMRATAAAGAGDTETATKAFESVINSGKLTAADQLKMIEALAGTYYRAKNYAQSSNWIQKYIKSGGSNPQMRVLLIQSMYLGGDYAAASKEVLATNTEAERAGGIPAENMLQLQASCQLKTKDYVGYVATLERLIKHYPKMEYWADIISRVQSKPGFPDRLLLDVYRLRYSSGNLVEGSAYVEFAQLALQEGFPSEAKKIVSEGFDKKLLGTGKDAQRHGRLRDLANRLASEDRNALEQKGKAGERDANLLVNDGYAYVTYGELEKGIGFIEKGFAKGGVKRPEDATLHLGMAYIQAGNKAKAAQALKSIARSGSVGDLARLWMLLASVE
ncbi:MAG: tetratricopeptide repeat protein [Methylotenera sp.]